MKRRAAAKTASRSGGPPLSARKSGEPPLLLGRAAGAIAFALVALCIYAPAFHGGWLWDDREDVPDNLILRSAHALRLIWGGRVTLDYYPIKNTLQWLQWQMWGDHTLGYHATNVGLHVLSACLLWRLLQRLGLRPLWAWVGGLLFLVHPIAVGSVAWIAEFKDCLSLPLLLLAAGAYLTYDQSNRPRCLFVAWLWFAAAMLAKSSVMMFPACLLLYGWWARRPLWRVALSSLPFFAVSLICGWIAIDFQAHRSVGGEGFGLGGPAFRLELAGETLAFYFRQAVCLQAFAPVYVRWPVTALGLGCWALWAAAAAGLWHKRETWGRPALLGLGWFALNLAPALGLVGISFLRFTWVMDHLAYASLIGLAGLAAAGLQRLASGHPAGRLGAAGLAKAKSNAERGGAGSPSGWLAASAVGVATVFGLALALESRAYAPAYAGEEAIWTYTAAHQPRHWMGLSNLGTIRIEQGRLAEAEGLLLQAVKLNPDAPDAHRNLAVAENRLGKQAEAIAEAKRALELRPDYFIAESDVGTYLAQSGKFAESLPYWEAALRLNPADPDVRNRYGLSLLSLGRRDEGVAQLRQALASNPNFGPAELNLGIACANANQPQEALAHFEAAARLMPDNPDVQKQVIWARSHLTSSH